MPEGTDTGNEISIDTRVANTLASQLANENLQLRQQVIRQALEIEELQAQLSEAEDDSADKKKK